MHKGCTTASRLGLLLALALGLLLEPVTAQTSDTVCYGGVPLAFVSTNNGFGSLGFSTYAYEWEDSTASSGAWTPAPGINSDTVYQPGALVETTYFRRVVRVAACSELAYSNVLQVVVLDSLTLSFSGVTNASCSNTDDGSATATPVGGGASYTYQWNNGTTTPSTNLPAGNFSVTVTDNFGCSADAQVAIGFDHPAPAFSFPSDTVFIPSELIATTPLNSQGGFSEYLWSTGATDSTTLVSSPGYYFLTVTGPNGCETTDSVYVALTTGLAGSGGQQLDVRLFPNPTQSEVTVLVGQATLPEFFEIRTLTGRLVEAFRNTRTVDVSGLASGVYLVHIRHEGNRTVKRLVIE